MNLFPKDEVFYNLFEKQTKKLMEASELLENFGEDWQDMEKTSFLMKKLEKEADSLGHEITDNLRKSFITPIEGEDIDVLWQKLDDIMDGIERAVNRIVIYKIKPLFPKEIKEYIKVIRDAISEINEGVGDIRNIRKFGDNIHQRSKSLNRLENIGDDINREALRKLMNCENITPEKNLEIMKLKEIYDILEDTIDACEDVGNIFEAILIKNR